MILANIFHEILAFCTIWCSKCVIFMRKTAQIAKLLFSFFIPIDEIGHMHEEKYRFWNAKFAKCDFGDIFGASGSRKTRINDYWTKKCSKKENACFRRNTRIENQSFLVNFAFFWDVLAKWWWNNRKKCIFRVAVFDFFQKRWKITHFARQNKSENERCPMNVAILDNLRSKWRHLAR